MDRKLEQRTLERAERKHSPQQNHAASPPKRKGTGHGKCYHCDKLVPYDRMDLNNGHLVCNNCLNAFDIKPTTTPAPKPSAHQIKQQEQRSMEKRYHQAMKVTAPTQNIIASPPKPKTMSQRWAEIDTTRLSYLLKGIIHLKYIQ